ncbi:hypothetical protein [Rubrivirga sp. IMCC45206]|uniref:hypothetical protein n=1 Tax=Rubrivirga sp. IMCC45206 TaxID=3391614 RepID=UPI003990384E
MRPLLLTALLAVASGCGSDDTTPAVADARPAIAAVVPDSLTADSSDVGEPAVLDEPVDVPADAPAAAPPVAPLPMPPTAPSPSAPAVEPPPPPAETPPAMDGHDGHTMEDGTRMDGDAHHDGGHGH